MVGGDLRQPFHIGKLWLKAMMQNTREALGGITVVKIKQSQSV